MTTIIGAGLSGLLAGVMYPTAAIIDSAPPHVGHRAVLRFRTDQVGRATGIDFRRVTVRKGIWYNGQFREPNVQLANWYSAKSTNGIFDRSVWNLEPVTRYIAPDNFHEQLIEMCEKRIQWGVPFEGPLSIERGDEGEAYISTMPMPLLVKLFPDVPVPTPNFQASSIKVDRYRIKVPCDVFQTIYYPSPDCVMYRVSITGSLLIIEYIGDNLPYHELGVLTNSLGLREADIEEEFIGHAQRFGKIAPINEEWRKAIILHMTQRWRIYSAGRFALWKNVLLDDVHNDLLVIKRLMRQGQYEHHINSQKG